MDGRRVISSGHGHTGLHLQHEELTRALRQSKFRELCLRKVKFDFSYDQPFLAGYSSDGYTRFVDRHFCAPGKPIGTIEIEGHGFVNVLPFLIGDPESDDPLEHAGHEGIEYAAMGTYGWSYSPAHMLATGGERRCVVKAGIRWAPYVKAFKPYIKADEHEKLERMPRNFDWRPILSKPIDYALVARVREAMGEDQANKQDKATVHYEDTRGRPAHHCGPDHEWKEHKCEYWQDPLGCKLVRGIIAVRGGCDLFEDADG